jgi:hypothetical protein
VNRPASELLYDSEGALRLVATALQELQGSWELLNAPPPVPAQREHAESPTNRSAAPPPGRV